mmetsp:Transcript_16842/g.67952  ORF Transcript_16842/g.67952 Transcript_16842/m.67952 type:complete len:240 (-) Transcript_16842:575-1294(-)
MPGAPARVARVARGRAGPRRRVEAGDLGGAPPRQKSAQHVAGTRVAHVGRRLRRDPRRRRPQTRGRDAARETAHGGVVAPTGRRLRRVEDSGRVDNNSSGIEAARSRRRRDHRSAHVVRGTAARRRADDAPRHRAARRPCARGVAMAPRDRRSLRSAAPPGRCAATPLRRRRRLREDAARVADLERGRRRLGRRRRRRRSGRVFFFFVGDLRPRRRWGCSDPAAGGTTPGAITVRIVVG